MSKMRSPNYPAYSLRNCVEWAERIWKAEGKTPLSPETAAVAAGYKGLSGPSRTAIASLKKFGLLEEGPEGMKISALALNILHPTDEFEGVDALRTAALTPGLFEQLYQTHAKASANSIAGYLINKLGFSQTGATACAEAFRDTVQFARLDDPPLNQSESFTTSVAAPKQVEATRSEAAPPGEEPDRPNAPRFTWPLTNGITAEIRLSRSDFNEEDIDLLCAYLVLAKRSLTK
jgi:hypothetical protein